jgi:hypothetical protein
MRKARAGLAGGSRQQYEEIMSDINHRFDPDALLVDELVVDKVDVAGRQIDCAIAMFFHEWDVVCQHTLISAAHGIVYDLATNRGMTRSIIKDSPLVSSDEKKEFIRAIHLPQNYFKHADSDSDYKLVFRYQVSHFFLFDAIRLFVLLDGAVTGNIKVFLTWFQLRYPDLLCLESAEEELRELRNQTTDPQEFKAIARQLVLEHRQADRSGISVASKSA